jgi:RsiW-degrading membrane proteinase PrsW (M82 family)
MKGLGVLFISGHHEYNDTLTGLLLGFTCGVGFAFVENWFYFSAKVNPFEVGLSTWGMLILYRSFFNTLAHGCFTASISTAIGYLRSIERLKKYARLAFVPGLFLAVAIHTIFNLSALADGFVIASQQVPFFIFNPMLIILLAAMFFLVLVLAVIDEKKRAVERSIRKAVDTQPGAARADNN